MIKYNKINICGINIFYRETTVTDKPTLILFHCFPSSSPSVPQFDCRNTLTAPPKALFLQAATRST